MLNTIIEVGIGLVVLYSLLGVLCSAINELVATAFARRARNLQEGVENLIGDKRTAELYKHPLIRSLYREEGPKKGLVRKVAVMIVGRIPRFRHLLFRPPSYLPADKFALALLNLAAPSAVSPPPEPPLTIADCVTRNLAARAGGDAADKKLMETLDALWRSAGENVDAFVRSVESWFNDSMARVAGWYKRKTQWSLLVLGLLVAVSLNVNTITISQRLWTSTPLRSAVVEQSKKLPPPTTAPDGSLGESFQPVKNSFKQVSELQLPMGWGKGQAPSRDDAGIALAGWLLTAVALSLGAPFWFDLLNKVAGLRNTGAPEKLPAKDTAPLSPTVTPTSAPPPDG